MTFVILIVFFAVVIILIVVGFFVYVASNPLQITSDTLPRLVSNFTGRENETEQLVKLLDFSIASPDIVNIVGGPGFGKSALSFAVGRAILKKGIQVHYVNLRQKKDVEAAKIAIVTAVRARKDLRSKWNPKLLEFWAAKCKIRTVLILDNCDDLIDQSRESFLELITDTVQYTFILKLLVTSQIRLQSLETEISNFHLNPLRHESSFLLLTRMFPKLSAEHADSLLHLSGNVPLALKLVGALLQDGVHPQTLKNELQKHPIKTLSPHDYSTREHLSACIGAAYKRLSNTLRHALAIYSLIPGTFDMNAAGGVLNMSSSHAEINVVNRLRNRCLIEYDGHSRLEIHRLITAYVREADAKFLYLKLPDFESNYIRHFSKQLRTAGEAYSNNVASKEGLSSYDLDQHNFIHLIELLMNPSELSAEFIFTTVELALKAADLLRVRVSRRYLNLWHHRSLFIVESIKKIGHIQIDSDAICYMIENFVDFHYQTKDKTKVRFISKRFLHLLEECDVGKTRRIKIMRMLCFGDTQELEDAHMNLTSAFQCHQETSLWLNISDVTSSLYTLADVYSQMRYIKEAKKIYQHFLETCDEKNDSNSLMLRNKAATYIWLIEKSKQKVALKMEAVSTLDEYTKQTPNDLFARAKFAQYLYDLKHFDEAEVVVRDVIMAYKNAHGEDVYDLILPFETLGSILREKDEDGHCDELLAVYNQSYRISLRELKTCPATVGRLINLAKAIRQCKGDELALPYYRDLVSMQRSVKGRHVDVVDSLVALAAVLYGSSQYSEFFRVCKKAVKLAMNLGGEFDLNVFSSTSTDIAASDHTSPSRFFSQSSFSSFHLKKRVIQVISVKKNSAPPIVVVLLISEAPKLFIFFISGLLFCFLCCFTCRTVYKKLYR